MLSVVMIHTSTKILDYSNNNLLAEPLSLFLNQSSRFAVPVFFLISAFALELNYPQSFTYFSYLKKRFSRLFLPYFFWSIIYYFIIYPRNTHSFFSVIFTGDASYQLYFIPTLLIFYLIFPLLHRYIQFLTCKSVFVILCLCQILLLSIDYYWHPLPFPYPLSVFLLNFILFIVGIAACLHQEKILSWTKQHQKFLLFSACLLAILITVEASVLYSQTQNYLSFYSQWRPSILLYSLILAAYLFSRFNQIKNHLFIKKIASYSFFVYFIHVLFLELLWNFLPHSFLVIQPFLFLLVSLLSYLSAIIASKFPFLAKITG